MQIYLDSEAEEIHIYLDTYNTEPIAMTSCDLTYLSNSNTVKGEITGINIGKQNAT